MCTKKSLIILLSATILIACGGGGGGGSDTPSLPQYITPSVALSGETSGDAGDNFQINATISDPENRISSWEWSVSSDGDGFEYTYDRTYLSFTSPLWPEVQNVTIDYLATYVVPVLDANGNVSQASRNLQRTISIEISPIIPVTPSLSAQSFSQSGELNWTASDGTGFYRIYVNGDEGVVDAYTTDLIEQTITDLTWINRPIYVWNGEAWDLAKYLNLQNGETYSFEIAAINSAGASERSNSVEINPVGPDNEIQKTTNFDNTYNLTRLDFLGNPLTSIPNNYEWAAVKDNNSGLIWQVKCQGNNSAGDVNNSCHSLLGDVDDDFSYYESDRNGSAYGFDNPSGSECLFRFPNTGYSDVFCNTENYLNAMNEPNPEDNGQFNSAANPFGKKYAGMDDWRLPTLDEALQFVDYLNVYNKPFPDEYFSYNSGIGSQIDFWTSTQSGNSASNFVILSGTNGFVESIATTNEKQIIAVSGKDEVENNEIIGVSLECFFWENPEGDSSTFFYEYSEEEVSTILADKRNATGIDYRIPSVRQLAYFRNILPKYGEEEYERESSSGVITRYTVNPIILSSDPTPSGQVYDHWGVGIAEDNTFQLTDVRQGTWYYCFTKPN